MINTSSQHKYESWPRQKVNIADLFIDNKNIRIGTSVELSQDALINDLFSNEDAMQVLKSIAMHGFFPDEMPVVVKEKGKFIVLEGNRRVAALKALFRPEITPSKESSIKEILKNAVTIPEELEVVIAPDRDSAMVFLASKHTLDTKRKWLPLRQAYFYKAELERGKTVKDLRNDYPTVDVGKFLRLLNVHKIAKSIEYDSDEITKKVHNERTFSASTIERLYDDKQVRDFLGFEFDGDGDLKINIEKSEFEKGFKKIIQDVAEKVIDSRKLNTEEDREKYLVSFPEESIPKKISGKRIHTSKDFKEKEYTKVKQRRKLAPRDIQFTLQSPGVGKMLIELQTIDYHKFPNATHDLLRSFLECALKAYFVQKGTPIVSQRKHIFLNDVLQQFINEMDSIKNLRLAQITQRIKSESTMQPYSKLFLDATNHNPDIYALAKNVEEAWDTMEPLFRYILDPTK